jgi:hypothetical protein
VRAIPEPECGNLNVMLYESQTFPNFSLPQQDPHVKHTLPISRGKNQPYLWKWKHQEKLKTIVFC